ncbi:MAG: transporter [Flavipsychrobacter sp.]|jgi:POT family proton-dependent oligopeptide transporter|nr:transporter [Flavipsychrobacter sp.]
MTAVDEGKSLTLEQIQTFEGKYPKRLWYLFFSEMWERFAFYGMRGMLTVFMTTQLLMKDDEAQLKYGGIQAFIYAMTFVGGLFADKLLGFRKSIFWGGLLMIIGSFTLAAAPKELYYIGISFTIIGTGFFKPNISSMVGSLYKEGDPRRDAGFGLFYSGINIGALLGGWLCIVAAKQYSWNIAFGLAGVGMIIGLLIFVFTKRTLGPIGLPPMEGKLSAKKILRNDIFVYLGSLLVIPFVYLLVRNSQYTDYFMYIVGPIAFVWIVIEILKLQDKASRQKMVAAMVFIIFSIFFWAFFEQAGGSLSLFALNNLHDTVLGVQMDPNAVNNSSNSVFVVIFSPLAGLLWLWLAKRKAEPNTVIKFGIGFLFVAVSFYLYYYTRFFADASGKTSLDLFTFAYLISTLGELCLSPIGLSLMTTLAPKPLHGMMMGMWFLASAYGQYAAGILGAGMSTTAENATNMDKLIAYTDGYKQLAIYALIAGVVLIVISPIIRKLMHEVH